MSIPSYKTLAGQFYPIGSLLKDDGRICVLKTTEEEVIEYANLLASNGFERWSYRLTPSSIDGKNNISYTYYNDKTCVVLFWESSYQTARIVYYPKKPLPPKFLSQTTGDKTPFLTQCKVEFGSSYVIGLSNGNFLLVDGGNSNKEDQENLYNYLKSYVEKNKKIVIEGWFFTHPDCDHITLATNFINEYKLDVEIKAFIYQFPDLQKVQMLVDKGQVNQDISALENAIKNNHPSATVYTSHTGQVYSFDGVDVEILYSLDDTYPMVYPSPNEMSLALKLTFRNGESAILLGDCMNQSCRQIAFTYGSYLKSKIMQTAHHGLIGGDTYLYKAVDPKICLWDTQKERFYGKRITDKYQWCIGEGGCDYNRYLRDESISKREHFINSKNNVFLMK